MVTMRFIDQSIREEGFLARMATLVLSNCYLRQQEQQQEEKIIGHLIT